MRTLVLWTLFMLLAGGANAEPGDEIFSDGFEDCAASARWSSAVGLVEPVEINGRVWHDTQNNGEFDPGYESGQSGWTVWADRDGDGSFDAETEMSVASSSGGWYTLGCLPRGSNTIRLQLRPGWIVTTPVSGAHDLVLSEGDVVAGIDFGTRRESGAWDFGDAPDPTYTTWDQSGGATHLLGSGIRLGSLVDAENNGRPNPTATGEGDDDDGVTFVEPLVRGAAASVQVDASAPAFFDLWIDTGRDGFWVQPEDHVIDSEPVPAGSNNLEIQVPAASSFGPTFARARISSTADLGSGGETLDGEVEDYLVEIVLEHPQDFGDAPDTFGTLGGSGGPIHNLQIDTFLGRNADGEVNGQPTEAAEGDDVAFFDDEDGVEMSSHLVPDDTATVTVYASAEAYLDAWVDFDQDGTWDPGERILLGSELVRGLNDINFLVPASAGFGSTHGRFRMSDQAGASPGGLLLLGEVEDLGKVSVEALDWGDAPDIDEGPFETKINSAPPGWGDAFGAAVDLVGDRAIVGAWFRPEGSYEGSAYIYRWNGAAWEEETEIHPGSSDRLGFDVALSGSTAVIGQYSMLNEAYIYQLDGGTWEFKTLLEAAAGEPGDGFGKAVDIFGSRVIIGADQTEIGGRMTGAAYFFVENSGIWSEVAMVAAADGGHGDRFGSAVAIGGSHAVVGAPFSDGEHRDEGAAFVYVDLGDAWELEQRLVPTDRAEDRLFGSCVAIDGNRLLITGGGAGYVFEWNPAASSWEERQKLPGAGGLPGSCDLDGDWAVVGHASNGADGYKAGLARLYHLADGTWSLWSTLHARDADTGHEFGTAVAVDGMRAVVGARGADAGPLERTGAVYIYDWLLDTDHYPTLAVNDGAYHSVLGGLRFGGGVDIESDGRPSDGADGDDLDHFPDEDGVVFTTPLVPGGAATVQVVVSNTGLVDAWIDFDGDGDWESPDEQILMSVPVTAGSNLLDFNVPSWAVTTPQSEPTVGRFRVSFNGGLGPGGYAGDGNSGEVEDHPVWIADF